MRPNLVPYSARIRPIALLSTSSTKSATALEQHGQPGQSLTASGKIRKEVPLPSQEKKEGAMQYVLYEVLLCSSQFLIYGNLTPAYLGPRLIKLPIGRAKVPCGP